MNFNLKTLLIFAVFSLFKGIFAGEQEQRQRVDKIYIIDSFDVYDSVKKLINEGININNLKDRFGRTILAEVVDIAIKSKKDLEKSEKMLKSIPDDQITLKYEWEIEVDNEKYHYDDTIKAINLLLVLGADFYIKNDLDMTPYKIAEDNDDKEILEIFNKFQKDGQVNKMYIIDPNDIYESVRKLIYEGININNVKDKLGRTMLAEVVDIAIKSKKNLQQATRQFIDTPDEQVTLKYEYEQEIEVEKLRYPNAIKAIWLLLIRGADFNMIDYFGRTPYSVAKNENDQKILEMFNKFKTMRKKKIQEYFIPVLADIVSEY